MYIKNITTLSWPFAIEEMRIYMYVFSRVGTPLRLKASGKSPDVDRFLKLS